MNIVQTQTQLAGVFGPSGQETAVAQVIEELAAPYADELYRDVLGNLIVRKAGNGPKVMFSAHMDSIGFIVTHIDKNGFLRFSKIGFIPYAEALGSRIVFANGLRGVVCADGNYAKSKEPDDLYIDIGASDEAEARSLVSVGDMAVYDQTVHTRGDILLSPYLDARIACAVLLSALEAVQRPKNDLYFVFSVQEELGLRGAKTAAFALAPTYGFAVDVTEAGDTPEHKPKNECRLGGGAAIKYMDSSIICHPKVTAYLQNAAELHGVRVQREILRAGGTDAGAIHRSRAGVYTGAISIPARLIHNPVEMCNLNDAEECVKLVGLAADIELE